MAKVSEDIGLMYIAESSSPEENHVTNLTSKDLGGGCFFAEFDTCLHTFRCMNRNARKYWGPNCAERLKDERIVSMLNDNAWYGEMDHPFQMYEDQKLTPERVQLIYMPNRSHKIMNPVIVGDMLTAKIQTASGTEAGRGFYNEIMQGLIPSFSCRSIAGIKMVNGEPYVIMSKLITYDWVLYPSHKDAKITSAPTYMAATPNGITRSDALVKESAQDGLLLPQGWKSYTQDVMIPLQELVTIVAERDDTVKAVMEAFELDLSSLVGFDHMDRAIIRDEDNVLFVNTSPKTRREVKDYLSSF